MKWRALLLSWALLAPVVHAAEQARVIDDFSRPAAWTAEGTDDIGTQLRVADGQSGKAVCLDFDFHGVSGGAALKRALPMDWPDNFALSFDVRGSMPPNDLQLKLADASGDNVWWYRREAFQPGADWQTVEVRRNQVEFAWGPTKNRTLHRTAALEFTIYAGQGGRGELCLSNLRLRPLPVEPAETPAPRAQASSTLTGYGVQRMLEGKGEWRSDPSAAGEQSIALDLGLSREFGGLLLHWLPGAQASRYEVELSDDNTHWRTATQVTGGNGGDDALFLPQAQARYVRLRLLEGPGKAYGLTQLEVKDRAWGASPNVFFQEEARRAPRGMYPRGFSGEQSYWTLLGTDGGARDSALISEDGAVEVGKGGWSLEPMLFAGRNVIDWATVRSSQSLLDGYLPIPSVRWTADSLTLDTTAFATGDAAHTQLVLRYTLTNRTAQPQRVTLALLARPFQVNPPTQFLNMPGGIHRIHDLAWDGKALTVNDETRVVPLQAVDGFVASSHEAGPLPERLAQGERPEVTSLHDGAGFLQGALLYAIDLPAHGSRTLGLVVPPRGADFAAPRAPETWLREQLQHTASAWREKLNRVALLLPSSQHAIADTARSALAQILMSRDGPALQPGTRSYARSWVRDGAMMTEGLVRSGHAEAAADFVRWYAPHQFSSGKVPCCVDARGADPVPENDSHGELIFAIAELWRYTHDRAVLERQWPAVQRAIAYMDRLRESERSPANQTEERRALYGLMPASISHEGYSAKPMHSYWDDFWALQGYDDAVLLAKARGDEAAAARIAQSRDVFRGDLKASIDLSVRQHRIDYLPGAAELGDFDATSTTIALSPGDGQTWLPPALLERTFERYWQGFVERRDGTREWEDYTPYELRTIASFVRLGWRGRIGELLAFFFADRRPAAWNQWAEVVGRDARKPRFVGDMPHAWIASDYLRSAYDLFAYERPRDQALVLAAGIPAEWLKGEGIGIRRLRTPYGQLSYRLYERDGTLELRVEQGLDVPPGGLVLPWPYAGKPAGKVVVNGTSTVWRDGELVIRALPVTAVMATPR
ncbi:discoidin domain-containing protein [Dyella marensis]|uniref:discoidin domain-containing protein n=1 Tax=Dyella marensis TaxID=500610 RepID=UPI0031D60EB3